MTLLAETSCTMETPALRQRQSAALTGALLGTAVGDALGLPMEGLSARRQQALFPGPLRHRFFGPWGMVSDDTEHTVMLAQALLASLGDPAAFQTDLARRLRWWLVGLPAGVGFATLRAVLKLWLGIPARRSGVMSAGNGAAMRTALLGVYFASDPTLRKQYVAASTAITHRDARAEIAAHAIAETATWMTHGAQDPAELLTVLRSLDAQAEWTAILTALEHALGQEQPVADFAAAIGARGQVSGYAFQSVPVALHAAIRHRHDFAQAIKAAVECGGDTDTVAAMTGALVGAHLGPEAIPRPWLAGLREFPRSTDVLRRIAEGLNEQLNSNHPAAPVSYFWPALLLRNLVFLGIVLGHGLRRLLPPY